MSLGLGGITNALGIDGPIGILANSIGVSQGSQTSISKSYNPHRFLVIMPGNSELMSVYNYTMTEKHLGGSTNKKLSNHENVGVSLILKTLGNYEIKQGETKNYSEENTPYSEDFSIAYSFDPDFVTIKKQKFEWYVMQAFGDGIDWLFDGSHESKEWFEKKWSKIMKDYDEYFIVGY